MRCRTVDDIAREALRIIDEESSVRPEPRAEFFFRGESKNHKSDYDDEPENVNINQTRRYEDYNFT